MKERSSRPRPGWWIRSCYMDAAGWHGNFKCKTHYDDVKGPCPAPTRCSCTIPCKEQAGNREAAPAFISHSRRLVFRPDQARQYARTQYARLASFRQNARRPLSLMLRSIAARRERRRFRSPNALRCVSKHEGEPNRTSSSFETRVRAFEFLELLRHARSSG